MASSNLLPDYDKDFRSKNYWDKFFKIRGSNAFEWYGEYINLCDLIHKYIKLNESILNIGCGNSKLSENMYDNGYLNITNIDISDIVIKQMNNNNKTRLNMKFLKMDMLNMDFNEQSFDVVIDKGTLDALMSGQNSNKINEDCEKLFNEIDKILKYTGRYICISLSQSHIVDVLLNVFANKGWFIRIHKIDEQDIDFYLPVFVFVFTKLKQSIKLQNPIIELKFDSKTDKYDRVTNTNDAKSKIKEYQQFGLAKFYIINKEIDINDDVFVNLFDNKNTNDPRYIIYIIDIEITNNLNGPFAAFVVPLGKEIGWLYGTKEGRYELSKQAKYQRLLVVHLNRLHQYNNLNDIINELSNKVLELAPKSLPKSYKVPILSEGNDVDIRNLIYNGNSKFSGQYYIEDVTSENVGDNYDSNYKTRRLVFQNINPIIQTEIILKKNKKKSYSPNYEQFLEDYFATLVAHLYVLNKRKDDNKLNILIIGLGGGVLTMYCKEWIKNCEIDAVEIDPEISVVAKKHFGLINDKDIRIHVDDGLCYIDNYAKTNTKKWDVIIIDVNNNDIYNDLWCPTVDFINIEFLNKCKSLITDNENSMFIMNLICRKDTLKLDIYSRLKAVWSNLYINKIKKNRNEILFCTNSNNDHIINDYDFNNDLLFNNHVSIRTLFDDMIKNLIKY